MTHRFNDLDPDAILELKELLSSSKSTSLKKYKTDLDDHIKSCIRHATNDIDFAARDLTEAVQEATPEWKESAFNPFEGTVERLKKKVNDEIFKADDLMVELSGALESVMKKDEENVSEV